MLSGFGSADVIFRDESEVDEVIEICVSLPLASSVRGLALLLALRGVASSQHVLIVSRVLCDVKSAPAKQFNYCQLE